MSRTFSPATLVTLPQLSASAAIAMGTDLLAKARAWHQGLPPAIARSLERLTTSFGELHASAEAAQGLRSLNPALVSTSDFRIDACWAGLQSFLQGWARTPFEDGEGVELAEAARRLLELVFPDGLKFTQLSYKLEWAESDVRLARLDQGENEAIVKRLGAEPLVENLRKAHVAYGEALDLTTARVKLKAQGKMREPLLRFSDALRSYAVVVAAHAADGDPEAQALAEALLAPVTTWRSGGTRKGKPDAAPGPEGEPDADGEVDVDEG